MPVLTLRGDLLSAVCQHLPTEQALLIGAMDPDDYLTHVEVYTSVRRLGVTLPDDLLREFVDGLLHYLERPGALV